MLRWCSYCQLFLGESAPFSDFTITHGICSECMIGVQNRTIDMGKAQAAARFFADIWSAAVGRKALDEVEVLSASEELGIRLTDLFVGVMQPMLHEIGCLFESGRLAAADEHVFSLFTERLLNLANAELGRRAVAQRSVGLPAVDCLLFCPDGNRHICGIRVVELFLRERGFHVQAVYPDVPKEQVLDLVRTHDPALVGFSVAMPEQIIAVRRLAAAIGLATPGRAPPKVLVGGAPLLGDEVLSRDLEREGLAVYKGDLMGLVSTLTSAIKVKRVLPGA